MFNDFAPKYDLFNRLISGGMDGLWRKEVLKPLKIGMRVLDLGCGTGDLSLGAANRVGVAGNVWALDFSCRMLSIARQRAEKAFGENQARIHFVERSAEELPVSGDEFDVIVSGFVLRNIYENINEILDGVLESLKKGGQIRFLDITEPANPVIRRLWYFYMRAAGVVYGHLIFGKDYPADYLIQSARRFMNAKRFARKLEEKRFVDIHVRSFMFGIITLYEARKR